MRIIAGEFRGRRLITPKDATIRPTTDRLRESIFNALSHRLESFETLRVADIFAGTGAFGLEALSRGASFTTFVEKHRQSVDLIKQNIDIFNIKARAEILTVDARKLPTVSTPFDVIFLDPPYGCDLAGPTLDSLAAGKWIASDGLIIIEQAEEDAFELPETLKEIKCIKQGKRRGQILATV